ncbi:ROK family transcriptional regulator [Paramicrobacterium agarici]|uniref:Putative NBD/HSP70 family sugar kinase n=1 Tax=Paramicrobacterium agarici TaxID=630514 RepID=A0A2A9DTF0_9MICO|nr:ROK family transcriptional regulator [Microbacterium agarici]PFG30067.1 putative NBD/HSP70 family sugar kinase [Microbacterium agarici]
MSMTNGVRALVRRTHEERVLSALRAHGALSRGELAAKVGLSRTTLSEITASLLQRGAIVVADTDAAVREGSGRPAERLALDPGAGQVIGVDFGHRRVHIAVADASHNVIASGLEEYANGTPWDERLAIAFKLVERLSQETGVHYGALQAVGIGVPGPYTGTSSVSPAVSWKNQLMPHGVDAAFEERFDAPVFVDNNTRLAALAEASNRPDVVDNLVYLRLSDGVGGGLVVSGRLVTGTKGFAGELGHIMVDPNGSMCRCGKRGCLETVASAPAILAACRDRGVSVETIADLGLEVAKSNPAVDVVLRDVGTAIGRVLGAAAMTLNPREIVLGGEIVRIAPVLVEQAASTIRYELYPIPTDEPLVVRAAQLDDSDGALGAIAAIFHQSPLLAGYPEPSASGDHDQPQRSAQ